MTLQGFRADVDQPFVRTSAVGNADRVYIGLNDSDAADGRTATVEVSLDGGTTYTSRRIETRNTAGQNGPSIRPAVAQDHTVYVAYFGWRSNAGANVTSDVVVVRDDSGATGATPFRDLVDPSDHLPGRLVATHVTIPWSNAPTLGQERIGSTLSIAVDALHSDNVYLAWADRAGTGDIYTAHVRRSTDRGATWSGELRTRTSCSPPSRPRRRPFSFCRTSATTTACSPAAISSSAFFRRTICRIPLTSPKEWSINGTWSSRR